MKTPQNPTTSKSAALCKDGLPGCSLAMVRATSQRSWSRQLVSGVTTTKIVMSRIAT